MPDMILHADYLITERGIVAERNEDILGYANHPH